MADFIKGLPELAVREIAPSLRDRVGQFETELRRVDFELPDGFEELQFRPLGIPGYREWLLAPVAE
ncbi:MAG: hypothetical protein MZW92_31615 [Comamonadaceae bacterium]|nr:hypothetical protein [Comamonadaceae bacterium]